MHRERRVHAAVQQRLVPDLRERARERLLALREHARRRPGRRRPVRARAPARRTSSPRDGRAPSPRVRRALIPPGSRPSVYPSCVPSLSAPPWPSPQTASVPEVNHFRRRGAPYPGVRRLNLPLGRDPGPFAPLSSGLVFTAALAATAALFSAQTPPLVIEVPDSGHIVRVGDFRPRQALGDLDFSGGVAPTRRNAIKVFGRPDGKDPRGCPNKWKPLGLRMVAANFGGGSSCAASTRIQTLAITGRQLADRARPEDRRLARPRARALPRADQLPEVAAAATTSTSATTGRWSSSRRRSTARPASTASPR